MNKFPKLHDYAMHHPRGANKGSLVRITHEIDGRFQVMYVQWCEDRDYVYNGGSSYSWPASDFRRVTDPILVTAVHEHRANYDLEEAKKECVRLGNEIESWRAARKAIRQAIAEANWDRGGDDARTDQ